jgi:hypothetical protein
VTTFSKRHVALVEALIAVLLQYADPKVVEGVWVDFLDGRKEPVWIPLPTPTPAARPSLRSVRPARADDEAKEAA